MRSSRHVVRVAAWPAVTGVVAGGAGMSLAAAVHLPFVSASMMLPWPVLVAAAVGRQLVRVRKASSKVDLASSESDSSGT